MSKSPSILKRRVSQSSSSSLSPVSVSPVRPASPSSHSRRSLASLPPSSLASSLHARVADALSTLHRQQHLHQSPPPPTDSELMAASVSTVVGRSVLTRSISASAADDVSPTSDVVGVEDGTEGDEVGDLPVFITSFHGQQQLPSHLSAAAPHIQATFPSPTRGMRAMDLDEEQNEDSTPLLVSSQPSSPAYTSSQSISTSRQSLPASAYCASSSSTSSSSSSSPSSTSSLHDHRSVPSSYSPSSSSPYALLHSVDKPSRCSRTSLCIGVVASFLAFGLIFYFVIFPRLVLLLTTGSPMYHEYEYYSATNAARRLYPHYYAPDGQYTEAAQAALHEATCPTPVNRTNAMPVIDVVPDADGITHLHIMVEPTSWTLFPWLWDSILVNHTWADPSLDPTPVLCTPTNDCHRCADELSLSSSCHKWFPKERLAVHLLNFPADRRLVANITTLLIVGQWYMDSSVYDWLKDDHIAPLLHPNFHLMTLLLMGEECFNWRGDWSTMQWKFHPRLAATFTTYGDCHLNPAYHLLKETELPNKQPIDMSQNIVYWPLGPSVEHGFPSRALREELDDNSAERQRDLLLNMMVSITAEKSTRMQAWMVTTDYCQQHSDVRCYNHNNDLVWKIITHFDAFAGTSFHTILPIDNPTDSEYLPLLSNSTYTLCPAGKNPEQYRIWEALMVGSIPIIEDPSSRWPDEPFMHPAYGVHHRCTRYDVHRVLRKYKAPVLFVEDWRQLGGVLDGLTVEGVVQRRRELKTWFRELKVELRREMFERVKYLNGRKEGD